MQVGCGEQFSHPVQLRRQCGQAPHTGSCQAPVRRTGQAEARSELGEHLGQGFDVARLGEEAVTHDRNPDGGLCLGVAGEHDARHSGVGVAHQSEQLGPVHAGHAHVRHHDVAGCLREMVERLRPSDAERHVPLVSLGAQGAPEAVEDTGLVVDEQDRRHYATAVLGPTMGSLMTKRLPVPTSERTSMVPPCFSWTTARARASP